ncbi:uncharacterized protein [Antedon mediterranea]|uniref:uncharacterized protein isoform X2 n=1 Tax=Antedon mediterranea TaxID=105859 RepID=UPI003AF8B783
MMTDMKNSNNNHDSSTISAAETSSLEVDSCTTSTAGGRRVNTNPSRHFYLSPHTFWMQRWEALVVTTVIFTSALEVFIAVLDSRVLGLWVFVYLCDFIFIIDIVLRFFVGYMKNGILISDVRLIRKHYLRTTFIPDIVSVLPLGLIVLAKPGIQVADGFVTTLTNIVPKLAQYRCMNRLLRVYRIESYFEMKESKLGTNTVAIRTIKYTTYAGLSIHFLACFWYLLSCSGRHGDTIPTCDNGTWAAQLEPSSYISEKSTLDAYIVSLYWAVATTTSTGYGDISAITQEEKAYSIVAMLLGIGVFYGVILGGMASMMTNFDSQRARYTHRLNVIKENLRDLRVKDEMYLLVVGYYEYLWVRKKGVTDDSMFNKLPLTFHAEVSLSANKYILDKAPMFQNLSEGFLRMLSLEIKPSLYLPNQMIAMRNEICHTMFFIHRGEAEVLSPEDDETSITRLRHGRLFGEVNLIFSMPRTNGIRASAHCDLMVLDRADLQNVLHHYPEVAKKLQQIAEERCDAAGLLEDRAKAGEGVIPASKSMKRLSIISAQVSKLSAKLTGKHEVQAVDALNIEEAGSEWVTVHRGTCRSRIEKQIESVKRTFSKCILMPNSRFAKYWERLVLLLTLIIVMVYPYVASFSASKVRSSSLQNTGSIPLLTCCYIMDFILFCDIFVRLRTAVVTPNGTYKDFKSIRDHYVNSWGFVVDVLAVLPLDLICLYTQDTDDRTIALYRLRLNRLVKYWRILDYFKNLEKDLNVKIGTIRVFKFVINISLLSHWSACFWYIVACITGMCRKDLCPSSDGLQFVLTDPGDSCNEGTWVDQVNATSPFEEYVSALYWAAATMTSTGYGDISAHTTVARFISVVAMLVGLLLYGYCLSSIAATLANSDAPRVGFQEKLFAVQEFMKDHGLSNDLTNRVINYLSLVFRKHRGEAMPGGELLMHDMPIRLQQDVAFEDAKNTIGQVPLFQDCDEAFIRMLALQTHAYLFTPGDVIVYEGDMGREMYFIRRGTCEIMSKDMTRVVSTIGPGHYFGEVGLIFGDYRTATVRAASYCEVLMLQRPALDEVLDHFPLIAKQFKEAAENKNHLLDLQKACKQKEKQEVRTAASVLDEDSSYEATVHKPSDASVKVFDVNTDDYLNPFRELNIFGRIFSKLLMSRALLSDGKYCKWWEILRVAVALISTFTITLQACFLHTDVALWGFNYFLDIICYVDMYLKFHMAFNNSNSVQVTHPLSTAKHYLRTNFVLDLLAIFPTELIAYAVLRTFSGDSVHIYALVRVNRLLQLYRVPLAFNYLESGVERETDSIRKVKFLFYLLIFIHLLACAWYFNACPPITTTDVPADRFKTNIHYCYTNSWTNYTALDFRTKSIGVQYIISLYWASATGASVGYGDIHANNVNEMVLALLSMIMGIVFFGYIIASVAASLANADAQRARYQEKLTAVKRYLKDHQSNKNLEQRVITYYNYLWLRNKGVDPDSLFDGLPLSLKADVTLNLYQEMINKVPLFQDKEVGFQKMLSMCMRPVLFLSGEYVVRKFDFGKEMFFIHRGIVEVVSEDGCTVYDTMESGRYFGEISLVFSCPRTASIRARTNVDMFTLNKGSLDAALTHYPPIKESIYKVAEERINAVRKRSKAHIGSLKKPEEKAEGATPDAETEDKKDKQANGKATSAGPTILEETSIEIDEVQTVSGRCCITRNYLQWFLDSNRFVLNPDSKFVVGLKRVTSFLIFLTTWTILYQACFQVSSNYILVFSYVSEAVFVFEIYVKFHVSCANEYGDLERDFNKVYKSYLKKKSGFILDVVAALPLDILALAGGDNKQKFLALTILRLIHLVRLYRLSEFFKSWETELNINVFHVRMTKFFVILVIVIHFFASLWYLLACPNKKCKKESWAAYNGYYYENPEDKPKMYELYVYCDCIYWCVATLTSTGYGDIHAYSTVEMVFASFVMVAGQVLFGSILGNIASTLANADSGRVSYEEKLDAIKNQMKDQKLPSKLRNRVISYFDYLWARHNGVDQYTLFHDAQYCLQTDIGFTINKGLLTKVEIFKSAEDSFLRALSLMLRPVLFMPNDFIVRQGDVGDEMYFIYRGTVEIMEGKNEKKVSKLLLEGDHFDDINLLYDVPRRRSVRARTHVDLHALSCKDLKSVLEQFTSVRTAIRDIGRNKYWDYATSVGAQEHFPSQETTV